MAKWTAFPYPAADYDYDDDSLRGTWPRLHAGDAEPWPEDPDVLTAWSYFHAGDFQLANEVGLLAGERGVRAGYAVANKAQTVYAIYLETSEKARLALLMEVAERAEAQLASDPRNGNAYYYMGHALARYSQGISIAKALAQGLGSKIKSALESAIKITPTHADAHIALGTFHAEVIDKVGSLIGRTQGASMDAGLAMFRTALKLNPRSAVAMVEYAHGLVMLEGDKKLEEATRLYQAAAAVTPLDAAERLEVEMARTELDD